MDAFECNQQYYCRQDWHRRLRQGMENLSKQEQDPAIQLPVYVMLQHIELDAKRIGQTKNFNQLIMLAQYLGLIQSKGANLLQMKGIAIFSQLRELLNPLLKMAQNYDVEASALYFWVIPEIAKAPPPFGSLLKSLIMKNLARSMKSPDKSRRMLAAQAVVRIPAQKTLDLLQKSYSGETDLQVKECLAASSVFISLFLNQTRDRKWIAQMEASHPRAAAYGYYRYFGRWKGDLPLHSDAQQWLGHVDIYSQWGA